MKLYTFDIPGYGIIKLADNTEKHAVMMLNTFFENHNDPHRIKKADGAEFLLAGMIVATIYPHNVKS